MFQQSKGANQEMVHNTGAGRTPWESSNGAGCGRERGPRWAGAGAGPATAVLRNTDYFAWEGRETGCGLASPGKEVHRKLNPTHTCSRTCAHLLTHRDTSTVTHTRLVHPHPGSHTDIYKWTGREALHCSSVDST